MLGTAKTNTLCTKLTSEFSIFRIVGISTNTHGTEFVCPLKDSIKIAREFRLNELNSTKNNNTRRTIERNHIALFDNNIGTSDCSLLCFCINLQSIDATYARSSHATSNNSSVGSLATM